MRKILIAALLSLCAAANAADLHDIVTKGSVDRSVTADIIDSTDGTPETGVVFNTSGIDLWYRREGAAVTSITEATLAALTTAHADGGFLHVANGTYRLDLPDAAFATGANYVDFGGTVTGMIVIGGRVRLIDASLEVANLAANVTQFGGTNGTFASGRPEVNTTHAAGTAWNSGAIGAPTLAADTLTAAKAAADLGTEFANANWALDATGQQTQGTFGQVLGDSAADADSVWSLANTNLNATVSSRATQTSVDAVDDFVDTEVAAILDDTGTSGVVISTAAANCRAPLGCSATGTLSGTHSATTADLGTNAPGATSDMVGKTLVIPAKYFARAITAYNTGTGVATFDSTALTLADADVWYLWETAPASGASAPSVAQIVAGVWDEPTTGNTTAGTFGATVTDTLADTNDIQTRLPAALVSGRMDASVGAMAANVLTSAAINADAFNAAKFAADVGTEFANATWALDATGQQTQGSFGQAIGDPAADTDSIWALANTNLNATISSRATQTSVDAVDDFVDDVEARLGIPANLGSGATLAANASDIEGQTDDIGVAGAGLTAADDAVLAVIAALNNLSATQVRDLIIEDQGGGVSLGCALAVILSYAAGDLATTGSTPTYKEPSGIETRATGTIVSNGNRTMTITCPTY